MEDGEEKVRLSCSEISMPVVIEQVQVAKSSSCRNRAQIQRAYPAKTQDRFTVQVSDLLFPACFQCPDYTSELA